MASQPRLAFVKIFVADLERAAEFYGGVLGLSPGGRMRTAQFDEVVLRPTAGQGGALVICRRHDGAPVSHGSSNGPLGFLVEDVDEAFARLIAVGASAEMPPRDFGPARLALLRDPDGHPLELLAPEGARETDNRTIKRVEDSATSAQSPSST